MTIQLKIAIVMMLLLSSGCAQFRSAAYRENAANSLNSTHEMYFGMARIAERNGSRESALKAYQRILDQNPQHVDSLHRVAVINVQANRMNEALRGFEQAMELSDSNTELNTELLCDYGYALYLAGDDVSAEQILGQALEMSSDNLRVANNLAMVLGRQGKYDEAFELFQLSGDRASALANLAYVQSQVGDVGFAKENYLQALSIDSSLTIAANGLYEIHQMFPNAESSDVDVFHGGTLPADEQWVLGPADLPTSSPLIRSVSFDSSDKASDPELPPVVQASYHEEIIAAPVETGSSERQAAEIQSVDSVGRNSSGRNSSSAHIVRESRK